MFGKYKHTLDPKGRLFVPAKLREELGSAFYVARSLDPCLTVYTEEEWQRIVERSKAAPSSKARGLRTFFANVVRCEPDKQGRFLLPDDLRKYAGIQQEVYFLGQAGRAEIWAAERYEEEEANVSAEELAAAGGLPEGLFTPLVKTLGIALVSRLGGEICRDAGQGAMAAVLDTAGAFGAVLVSLPLVRAAWELLRTLV